VISMDDFRFTTELDDENRIRVPDDVARKIPAHSSVTVQLEVPVKSPRKSNGALEYYMEHGVNMSGILPFDRDALYTDNF
jgi:hypothetical protein